MGRAAKVGFLVVSFVFILASFIYADEYPSRPIEYICGYPPGGVQDPQARGLCKAVEKYLGRPMVVVNKPGVGGVLALDYLAAQKPDGYTIGQANVGLFTAVPYFEKVDFKIQDFTYIMGFGYHLHGLCVKADAPWNTYREFIDYVKKNPGKVKYATYSPASTTFMVMDMIAQEEHLDWTHVPYKGDGPSITALLGGHVQAGALASGQVPYLRSGTLKLLAIFNSEEFKEFSKVPTLKSLGYKFPMLSTLTTYTGVLGPKGLRPEVLKKLEDAFTKAWKDPIFTNVMDSLAAPRIYKSAKEFEAEIIASNQICEKIVPGMAAKIKK